MDVVMPIKAVCFWEANSIVLLNEGEDFWFDNTKTICTENITLVKINNCEALITIKEAKNLLESLKNSIEHYEHLEKSSKKDLAE